MDTKTSRETLAWILARALERPDEERLHIVESLLTTLDRERMYRAVRNALYEGDFESQVSLLRELSGWVREKMSYMGRPALEEISGWSESSRLYVVQTLARGLSPGTLMEALKGIAFELGEKDMIELWEYLSNWVGAALPARKRYGMAQGSGAHVLEARLPSSERDRILMDLLPQALEDPGSVYYARKRYLWILSDLEDLAPGIETRLTGGARVVEVGPGEFAGVAALLAAKGAGVTMIDVKPLLLLDRIDYYQRLMQVMDEGGPFDWTKSIGFDGGRIVLGKNLNYLAPVPDGDVPVEPDGSAVAFSAGALEHVHDLVKLLSGLYQALEPGGITWHLLDLSDHRKDAELGPLSHLCLSKSEWKKVESSAGYYQSRRLARDYEIAFKKAGFVDVRLTVLDRACVTSEIRERLDHPFKSLSDDDLSPTDLLITARKPT